MRVVLLTTLLQSTVAIQRSGPSALSRGRRGSSEGMSRFASSSTTTVVCLRDELRVHDNALLADAARRGGSVLPVFCLDDRVFSGSAKSRSGSSLKTGARRARFVLG